MQYYDPKTDVVFKKVFGTHPNLTISLLNAVLQLEGKEQIESIEYEPSEILPIMGDNRNSAVDVRCKDGKGDYFIVEMQMYWSSDFLRRVLYNCAKVYATLYSKGEEHYKVKKVFSVNILNDIYQNDTPKNYHRYRMSEVDEPSHVIKGIEIVCVELPKFRTENYAQREMLKLWQEFLTSINAKTGEENISEAMLENDEVKEALNLCLDLTEEERGYYDGFWGMEFLRSDRDKTVREEGRAEGRAEGAKQQSVEMARMMKADGEPIEKIMRYSGLTKDEISKL